MNEDEIELTQEEIKLIESLKRLAKKWKEHGKRLALFGHTGSLSVVNKNNIQDDHGYIDGITAYGSEYI